MKYRLLDLFCGAGGMSLGFTDERFGGGFESVWAIDNEASAIDISMLRSLWLSLSIRLNQSPLC